MICYEVVFPEEVRQFAGRGAEFLVNITNDAWFGRSGAPYQHLAMAAMRAAENGSYLVRAANTGSPPWCPEGNLGVDRDSPRLPWWGRSAPGRRKPVRLTVTFWPGTWCVWGRTAGL
jgi:predicted amidohydrolase